MQANQPVITGKGKIDLKVLETLVDIGRQGLIRVCVSGFPQASTRMCDSEGLEAGVFSMNIDHAGQNKDQSTRNTDS